MSAFPKGAPTPSENWDDDFDFQPPSPPATSSSISTSKARPDLDVFGSSVLKPSAVERQSLTIREREVESWDDDFDYDPLDWTKDIGAKTGKGREVSNLPLQDVGGILPRETEDIDRLQPSMLSRPIPQRSSSTSFSVSSTNQTGSALSHHPMPLAPTASASKSNRRDRKRSSDHLPEGDSSRLDENSELRTAEANLSNSRTHSQPQKLPKNAHLKEGVFMRRISSVRRRISSSISIGPSSINNNVLSDMSLPVNHTHHQPTSQTGSHKPTRHSRPATSIDMPPPPVPISALRTSSLMNVTARKAINPSAVSSSPTRKSPEGMPFRVEAGINQAGEQGEQLAGLPEASFATRRMDSNASAVSLQEVGSSSFLPSPVLVTPPYSAETLSQANTGVYGFHLPSPSAGSAYNILNIAPGRRAAYRQTSETSSKPDTKYNESVRHLRYRTEDPTDVNRTPRAARNHARPVPNLSEDVRIDSFSDDFSRLSIDDQTMRSRSASGTDVESPIGDSADQLDRTTYMNRITSRESRVEIPESHAWPDAPTAARATLVFKSKQPVSSKEETALRSFRFGDDTSNKVTREKSDSSVTKQATFETTILSATATPPATSRKERARLSLQRIGSLSQRHSRRISDSWKNISGSATGERSARKQSQTGEPNTSVESRRSSAVTPHMLEIRNTAMTPAEEITQSPRELSAKVNTSGARQPMQFVTVSPLSGNQHDTALLTPVHQQSQAIPATMRSLSHNDSPTGSRFKTPGTDQMDNEKVKSERGIARRSSLGDLKIPSRVVSAQRGLKEEIGAMKQFAAGIQDLKALMAQHTILSVKQDRFGVNDVNLEHKYAPWWSLADLLVQLGETGSLSGATTRSPLDDEDAEAKARLQRQRRITLAPGTVLPSAHLSALSMDSESLSLLGAQEIPPMRNLSDSLAAASMTAGHTSQRSLSNIWRASTGRIDFSSAQLEELRGIIDKPQLPITDAPLRNTQPTARAKTTTSSRKKVDDGRQSLGPTSLPIKTLPHQRRTSKSNVTVFKDFWRAASGSQRSSATANFPTPISGAGRPALPKSQTRPSLASIFRRSSSKVTTIPATTPLRFSTDKTEYEMKEESVSSASVSVQSEMCTSPQSSLSDWDSPSQVGDLRLPTRPFGGPAETQHQSNMASLRPDAELTITRSDSRKLLAGLGRGPSPAVETKPASSQTESTMAASGFSTSAASSEAEASPTGHQPHLPVLLTPASLPPLLAKLNDVTRNCRTHLEVISERLREVDTRAPPLQMEGSRVQ